MRAVIQRVRKGCVRVGDKVLSEIGLGLVVLLGITHDDDVEDISYIVNKIVSLRIFDDSYGKLNLSIKDVGGEILLVSQFTLYGDCRKGRRPSFSQAATQDKAQELYNKSLAGFKEKGLVVEEGRFGEKMLVEISNDGPVTLLLDSKNFF